MLVHRCIKGSTVLSTVVLAETALHRSLGLYRNNLDRLVVPSRFYIDKLNEWGWPREKMVYIPNFVDIEAFETSWTGRRLLRFRRASRTGKRHRHADPRRRTGEAKGW